MGTLSYSTTMSLDGYIEDADGSFQWWEPSPEVFALHLARITEVSTEVLGRKTFRLMQYWEDLPDDADVTPDERAFGQHWRRIRKVVASSTLTHQDLRAGRVSLVPDLQLPELARIVAEAEGSVEIFGPTLAGPAMRAGMIDDFHLFVAPKVLGGGRRALPDGTQLSLKLAASRIFDDGSAYLHYRAR